MNTETWAPCSQDMHRVLVADYGKSYLVPDRAYTSDQYKLLSTLRILTSFALSSSLAYYFPPFLNRARVVETRTIDVIFLIIIFPLQLSESVRFSVFAIRLSLLIAIDEVGKGIAVHCLKRQQFYGLE